MSFKLQLEKISELAELVAAPMGMQIVDVRFGQMGRKRSLEVTIFKPGHRINLADCEQMSRMLSEELDKQLPPLVEGTYLLEVQSPGIDRQLRSEREFRIFAGETVAVTAKESVGNLGLSILGTLLGGSSDKVLIAAPQPLPTKTKQKGKSRAQSGLVGQETPAQIDLELKQLISIKLSSAAVHRQRQQRGREG